MVDREILDLLPKTKEAKSIVRLMDRDSLTFDVALQRMEDSLGVPKVYIYRVYIVYFCYRHTSSTVCCV
jgi:hypothetical protein